MKSVLTTIFFLLTVSVFSQDTIKTIFINDVVLLGIRANKKAPITEKTINRDGIDSFYQGQEVPIFLNTTPSVTSTSDGGHSQGYTYFRLRGIDQTRINMTLNGVPLNEPEDLGVYTSNYPMFLNNVKSIQIQRGVGTSTNGSSSFGGSINFESENGTTKKSVLELGYGSWNTKKLNYIYGSGLIKQKFSVFGSASVYGTDGYKYNSGGSGYSAFISASYHGKKDKISFTGFTGISLNNMAWLAVSESDIRKNPRINYNTKGDNDNFKQTLLQLQHTHYFSEKLKISSTVFYNRLDGNWGLDLNSIGAGTDKINYGLHSNFIGAISNLNYTSKKYFINFGVSGNSYNRTHSMGVFPDIKSIIYKNTGYKHEFSTFAKYSVDLWKFSLFVDAQYRFAQFTYNGDVKMRDISWNFFNPKGGIIFNQNKNINYYFSVGKSFREPTRTDMFSGNDNLIELKNVKHEEVIDYELGTNINYDKVKLKSNFYYMDFNNEITLQGIIGANGLPIMNNVSKSFRAGVEVDLEYRINKMFEIKSSMTYSYNRVIIEGKMFHPLLTPSFVANQFVCLYYNNFKLITHGKFHTKSYLDLENKFTTPQFFTLGMMLEYRIKNISLSLNGTNLTNQKYYTGGYVLNNERHFFVNETTSFYFAFKIKI